MDNIRANKLSMNHCAASGGVSPEKISSTCAASSEERVPERLNKATPVKISPGRSLFDLGILADNGLRRGYTTGSCAAAAVKAALCLLEYNEILDQVDITLPDREHYLVLPVKEVMRIDVDTVQASVIKQAGDDPDNTDGCTIRVTVKKNHLGKIIFYGGEGVGTVTQPGIRIPVGEPAINPGPREMICLAIEEIYGSVSGAGLDITISCPEGRAIAARTFNPRLGIVGGISILGTTGIVEPMSLAAYMASIEVYIRVALADGAKRIAFLPGNIGLRFAKEQLTLEKKCSVHISNFLGFALHAAQSCLQEQNIHLEELWLLGHPGKLSKVLSGQWDTSSRSSAMAMSALAELSAELGLPVDVQNKIATANTVEAVTDIFPDQNTANYFWNEVEKRLAVLMHAKTPNIHQLFVRLFRMSGQALNETKSAVEL